MADPLCIKIREAVRDEEEAIQKYTTLSREIEKTINHDNLPYTPFPGIRLFQIITKKISNDEINHKKTLEEIADYVGCPSE